MLTRDNKAFVQRVPYVARCKNTPQTFFVGVAKEWATPALAGGAREKTTHHRDHGDF